MESLSFGHRSKVESAFQVVKTNSVLQYCEGERQHDEFKREGPMSNSYYKEEDLAKFPSITELQKTMGDKFFGWYTSVFEEGALTAREKSLIALAVAHAVQCPYCIDAYTQDTLQKGCTEEQMMEAVHVAGAIRGGASLVHGVQMMNKAKKLSM